MLMPIRKDFSIINEIKAFLAILFVSSVSRNLVEIFLNDGEEENIDKIDKAFFYLQTIVFMLSVVVSFIYPVMIKTQLIIPLPSVPERIENIHSAILEPRGFSAFYEWLEEFHPKSLKFLN